MIFLSLWMNNILWNFTLVRISVCNSEVSILRCLWDPASDIFSKNIHFAFFYIFCCFFFLRLFFLRYFLFRDNEWVLIDDHFPYFERNFSVFWTVFVQLSNSPISWFWEMLVFSILTGGPSCAYPCSVSLLCAWTKLSPSNRRLLINNIPKNEQNLSSGIFFFSTLESQWALEQLQEGRISCFRGGWCRCWLFRDIWRQRVIVKIGSDLRAFVAVILASR